MESNPRVAETIWNIPLQNQGSAHSLWNRSGVNEQRQAMCGSSSVYLSQLPYLCNLKWNFFLKFNCDKIHKI
jgi:hypothetical protein